MRRLSLLLLTIFLNAGLAFCGDVKVVENPKPVYKESDAPCTRLVLVKEIKEDFDTDLFMVRAVALTPGRNRLFVYDAMLKRIYVFNEKFEYVTHFLKIGEGPGEIKGQDMGFQKIYYAPDNLLYVRSANNNKLAVFDDSGKHIKDIRLYKSTGHLSFRPVVDGKGNFYFHSFSDESIVRKFDPKLNLLHTYLKRKHNAEFIVYFPEVDKDVGNIWMFPVVDDIFYDITTEDMLLIYMHRSSKVFLFKGNKLVRKMDIIIDKAVARFRKRVNHTIKLTKGKKEFFMKMFYTCFVDKDNGRFFYFNDNDEEKNLVIYKFNLEGKLVGVIKGEGILSTAVYAKRNNLFYGIQEGKNVLILKEEVNQ
jgi:hypothetical protein